jgi:hypothetical protein
MLWREPLGWEPSDDGLFAVYFAHLTLVQLDEKQVGCQG